MNKIKRLSLVILLGLIILAGLLPSIPSLAWTSDYKLLLHMDGSDDGTTFTDEIGHSLSRSGTVTKTGIKKFGSASAYNSAANEWINPADDADWAFGTGAFTMDLWIYPTSVAAGYHIFLDSRTNDSNIDWDFTLDGAVLKYYSSGSLAISGSTLSINTWYHVAVVGNGGADGSRTVKMYLNGTQDGSTFTNDYNYTRQHITVGNYWGHSLGYIGYMDEVRILKGTQAWTSNFTPPNAPYADAVAPTVTTQATTDKTSTTATGNGNITDTGGENPNERGVCYSSLNNPPTTADSLARETGGSFGIGAYPESITGLSPNTTYYLRAYAINSKGTSYGSVDTFATLVAIPTVTTQAATSVSYTTATGNGNITNTGGENPSTRGICYSSVTNPPTTADSKSEETGGSFGTGAYTEALSGLSSNTHYYARAYATNSAGTAYGSVVEFDTLIQIPTVSTQAATDLAITQAGVTSGTFNGNLTNLGDSASDNVSFEYGLTMAYGSATTPAAKGSTGVYTAAIPNNLTAGATYHYRSKATNAYGTAYGGDQSFIVPTPGGSGTTYYVAKTGNDSNSGLTLGNAFLTISKATSVMVAGDTTIVKAGTYNELVYLSSSGSVGNPITLRAYTGDTVIIDGTGISGNLSALIQANSRSYWDIEGFELRNCGESLAQGAGLETYGLQFEGGGNNIFRNLKIHAIFGPGIWIEYNTASTIVDGVEIYNTNIGGYDEALDVQGSYVEVKNCIVHDTSGLLGVMGHVKEGIEVKGGSSNMSIHHNESYNNNVGFQADTYGTGYSYVDIYNNYIHDNVSSGISIESEKGLDVTNVNVYNNILFNNNSPGYGGIEIDVGWNNFASVPQFNNILISNNTIYGDSVRGIYFWPLAFGPGRTYSGNAVRNNIIVGMSSSATLVEYADYGSGGVTVDYNLYYDAAGYSPSNVYGTNSVIADPLLNNPAGGDFSIPTGSPAKDAGTATGAPSTDYIGTSRPQGAAFDIGAYEFITGGPPVAPSITISAATSIESTTATLNGNVTATGSNNPTVTVYWGTTDGGTTAGNWANNSAPTNPAQPQGINSFYYNAVSLPSATTIYFRAKATNSAGTTWASSTLSFLTKPAPPTNVAATDGTYTNKTTITWTKSTGATGYYVYRSGSPLSALLGDVATYDDSTGTTPVIVPGTGNATDGSNQSWVGLSVSGNSVTTTAYTYTVIAVNATGNSAESGGNTGYIGYGAPTYQWQRSAADSDAAYGDLAGATTASYNDTTAPADGSGRWYKLTISATGAAPATSTANRGYRSTGAALNAPTVLTLLVSTFTDTTATAGGNITDIGSANVTQRGVCYGLTAYPDTAGTKKAETAGAPFAAGTFNAYLTGLTPSTLYHVRAYAINANGTSYGDDSTFTTSASTPMPPTMPSTLDVQAMAKAFIPLTFLIIVVYAALKNIDTSDIGGLVLAGLIILVAVGLLAGLYAALP